ncbi:hypothetical protein, partial [Pseudomonas sp. SDO55104_S430]
MISNEMITAEMAQNLAVLFEVKEPEFIVEVKHSMLAEYHLVKNPGKRGRIIIPEMAFEDSLFESFEIPIEGHENYGEPGFFVMFSNRPDSYVEATIRAAEVDCRVVYFGESKAVKLWVQIGITIGFAVSDDTYSVVPEIYGNYFGIKVVNGAELPAGLEYFILHGAFRLALNDHVNAAVREKVRPA